jgi:enamine deaminase RidA (YjgF/YER057c/UK114 family)
MTKTVISTANAPAAIGTYSQAVRCGNTIYLSGQIGLDPQSMQLVDGIDAQVRRVFDNLRAVPRRPGDRSRTR